MIEISNEELAKVLNLWTGTDEYVKWVKKWEKRFGDKPQDDQPKDVDHCEASEQPVVDHCEGTEQIVDHSIPVRYDHLISTEELVKRARERWPEDGWEMRNSAIRVDGWTFGGDGEVLEDRDYSADFVDFRTKLLILIDEIESKAVPMEIPESLIVGPPPTKAERFYTFLATPQPDISPGLWGIAAMVETPVRGGDGGWAREDVGGLTYSDCEGRLRYD